MTTLSLLIKTAAELAAIMLLIIGFINENKLIRFERKVARVAVAYIRGRRRKKALLAQKAAEKQRHEAEYVAHRKSEPLPEKVYEQSRSRHSSRRVA